MTQKIIVTNDGSHSVLVSAINESYHSKHGAIAEAKHVFIKNGLLSANKKNITILEVGFGTGLNTLLSYQNSNQKDIAIDYHTIEPYPIKKDTYTLLNFPDLIGEKKDVFFKLHNSKWEFKNQITKNFYLTKHNVSLQNYNTHKKFDVIYFDAFSPNKQPDLWTESILKKIHSKLKDDGFLITYCAKGTFRRTLKKIGFNVVSLDGPPGKRQITRANRR